MFGNLEEFAYRIEMIQTLAAPQQLFLCTGYEFTNAQISCRSTLLPFFASPLPPYPCSSLFISAFQFTFGPYISQETSGVWTEGREAGAPDVTSSYIPLFAGCRF